MSIICIIDLKIFIFSKATELLAKFPMNCFVNPGRELF